MQPLDIAVIALVCFLFGAFAVVALIAGVIVWHEKKYGSIIGYGKDDDEEETKDEEPPAECVVKDDGQKRSSVMSTGEMAQIALDAESRKREEANKRLLSLLEDKPNK